MTKLPPYIRQPRPTGARSLRRIYGIHITPQMVGNMMLAAVKIAITALGCLAAWGLIILVDRLFTLIL